MVFLNTEETTNLPRLTSPTSHNIARDTSNNPTDNQQRLVSLDTAPDGSQCLKPLTPVASSDCNRVPVTFPFSPTSAKISSHICLWRNITSDKWVLDLISYGHTLEFTQIPPNTPPRGWHPPRLHLLKKEAKIMLQKGAIEKVPFPQRRKGFYSRFFLIRKNSGEWRPILDLRKLNKFLKSQTFRMVTLSDILQRLNSGNFMTSLDLEDEYFHVPIHPKHRKFLRFTVAGTHYQF